MNILKTALFLAVVNGAFGQYCDITSANKCWSPMTATMGDLIPSSTPSVVPPAVKVHGVCNGLDKVFACTENKMANCSPGDRLLYDTARSSAMFLCNHGKQGYIDHAQCLFSQASHETMKTCTSNAIPLIKSFIFTMSDLSELKWMAKPLCGLASTVRACLFDTARENCGHSAATYLQQYMDATTKPFSQFLSCPNPSQEKEYLPLPENVVIKTAIVPPYESPDVSNLPSPNIEIVPTNKRTPPTTIAPSSNKLGVHGVSDVQTAVPRCDRYCSVYQHNLPLSIKQGYDDWCEVNCHQGFCPPTSCTCDCRPVQRRIVCEAVGLRFPQDSAGSHWCSSVCQQGFCPKHYCKCRVELESSQSLH